MPSETRGFAALRQPSPTGNGPIVLVSVLDQLALIASGYPVDSQAHLCLESVSDDLTVRAQVGLSKYGTPLRAENGRSAALDMYQEILDSIMYAQQCRMEGDLESSKWLETLIRIATELVRTLNVRFGAVATK